MEFEIQTFNNWNSENKKKKSAAFELNSVKNPEADKKKNNNNYNFSNDDFFYASNHDGVSEMKKYVGKVI